MNDYEFIIFVLSLFATACFILAVVESFKADKYSRLYTKTYITADDAEFIMSIIQYTHSTKKPCEQLNPRTIALYNKCYNIKEFYDKEK